MLLVFPPIFVVNTKLICGYNVVASSVWTDFPHFSAVSIVNSKQVNASWV